MAQQRKDKIIVTAHLLTCADHFSLHYILFSVSVSLLLARINIKQLQHVRVNSVIKCVTSASLEHMKRYKQMLYLCVDAAVL